MKTQRQLTPLEATFAEISDMDRCGFFTGNGTFGLEAARQIAEDKVPGGKGPRAVGQFFYQDKAVNVRKVASVALAYIDAVRAGNGGVK